MSDGPIGEGTRYREYRGVGPVASDNEWEIIAFEPPTHQVPVGDLGIVWPELTMTFEALEGGTRFTQDLQFRALPAVSPLGWVLKQVFIKRALRSGFLRTQRNLKRLVEADG